MKTTWKKIIPSALLVLLFGMCAMAFASAPTHPKAEHAVETELAHDTGHAAVVEHGEAQAAHDAHSTEAVEAAAHDAHDAHAAEATGEGHGADVHHGNSLSPEKLKDLFWRTVNFLALIIILVKFLSKPIASGLSGRQQQIREEIESLEAKRDDAQQAFQEFEARLIGMEEEMERVVEKAIAQAQNEKERILAEAERAAEDIKRQAEAAVQAELADARTMLRDEVAEQAALMAEEMIVKNLTPADQVTITEQYLDRLGAIQ